MGILFDVLLLWVLNLFPGSNEPRNRCNDVFIPFEDRNTTSNRHHVEEKTDYFPHDFDDYGEF